jgi:deoxyribose-phosphate aldolase
MAVQDLRQRPTAVPSPTQPAEPSPERNPGTPLELDWVREVRVNTSAVERRAATLPKRRTVKKDWQAAWYLRAVTCMDLTTLQGDDTPGRVRSVAGAPPLRVNVGLVSAVNMQVDDRPIVIPRRAGKDGAKFVIEADGSVKPETSVKTAERIE